MTIALRKFSDGVATAAAQAQREDEQCSGRMTNEAMCFHPLDAREQAQAEAQARGGNIGMFGAVTTAKFLTAVFVKEAADLLRFHFREVNDNRIAGGAATTLSFGRHSVELLGATEIDRDGVFIRMHRRKGWMN